jgi:uncharacterized protein YrrD
MFLSTGSKGKITEKRAMHLRRTRDLGDYTIAAVNTDIGRVCDFYFDDERWTIRYIVVATGVILPGRKVLISPLVLRHPAWSPLHIRVNLTWEQVANSPSIDIHKPVSRQHEIEHHKYYGLPYYWNGTDVWGPCPNPRALANTRRTDSKTTMDRVSNDKHLRSTQEVMGYHVKATDGEIGHLEDFLFDDETWEIRYAIVDTKNWWPGKKVLLRPQWIKRVSWTEREIYANLSCEAIRKSPEWDADRRVSREYELRLHQHYGYAPYWKTEK